MARDPCTISCLLSRRRDWRLLSIIACITARGSSFGTGMRKTLAESSKCVSPFQEIDLSRLMIAQVQDLQQDSSIFRTLPPTLPSRVSFLIPEGELNTSDVSEGNELLQLFRDQSQHLVDNLTPLLPSARPAKCSFPYHEDDRFFIAPSSARQFSVPWLGSSNIPHWTRHHPPPP